MAVCPADMHHTHITGDLCEGSALEGHRMASEDSPDSCMHGGPALAPRAGQVALGHHLHAGVLPSVDSMGGYGRFP
jgi:hypothetical protein